LYGAIPSNLTILFNYNRREQTLLMKAKTLLLFGCLWALSSTIQAATLHVEQAGGSAPYQTITDALANCGDGDVIAIGPGIYTENLLIERTVTLRGLGPQYVTLRSVTDDLARVDTI